MTEPVLSIITVVRNDFAGLTRTRESVRAAAAVATDAEFDWLVIDGASTDGTAELLRGFDPREGFWISEPDNGLYDAMNKGIECARGRFLLFLNAGDELVLSGVSGLIRTLSQADPTLYLGSYMLSLSATGRSVLRRPRRGSYLWYGMPTSHQATFYPRALIHDIRYDESFKVTGDYDFTARLWRKGVAVKRLGSGPVSMFRRGGISSTDWRLLCQEAERVQREVLAMPLPIRKCFTWYRMARTRMVHFLTFAESVRLGPRAQ